MPHTLFNKLPQESWISDQQLRYCPWGNVKATGNPILWRTGQHPGTLEPFSTTAWSIHTGLPRDAACRSIHYFADGYTIFYERNQTLHEIHLWAIHPRAVFILCTEVIHPELISLSGDLQEQDNRVDLRLENETISLQTREIETGCKILLTSVMDDQPQHQHPDSSLMDFDASEKVSQRYDKRMLFWSAWEDNLPEKKHIHHSTEILLYSLRTSTGLFEDLWIENGHSGKTLLNHLLVQIAGLSWIDPKTALRVIQTACSLITPDGRMASFSGQEPSTLSKMATWPQACRAAASAASHLQEYTPLRKLLPKLHSVLVSTLRALYHPDHDLYLWPNEEESFLPDLYDESLATVDCSAMLLAEVEAYLHLVDLCGMGAQMDLSEIQKHQGQLEKTIHSFFAHPESHTYRDRMIGGDPVSRVTLSSVTPLLTRCPNSETRLQLEKEIKNPDQLKDIDGLRDWEPWEDDEEAPSVNLSRQFQFIPLNTTTPLVPSELLQLWQNETRKVINTTLRPHNLASTQAAFFIHLTGLILQPGKEKEPPPWLAWVEKRRKWVLPIPIIILLTVIFGITAAYQTRQTPPRNTIQALLGLAEHHYQMDEQTEALEILNDLYESGVRTPLIINLLAKSHFRAGNYEEAENFFESMNRINPNPGTELNIALSVYQQGRLEDAAALYREIAEKYRTIQPQISQRADHCIELMNYGNVPQPAKNGYKKDSISLKE